MAGGSVLLLVAALTVNQPVAMSFWLLPGVLLLAPAVNWARPRVVRVVTSLFLVFGAAGAVSFVILKVSARHYGISGQRTELTTDPLGRLLFFGTDPFARALTPWTLQPRDRVSLVLAVLLVCLLALAVRKLPGGSGGRAFRVAGLLLLLPLSYFPNLVVREEWASFRTLAAIGALVVLYAVMGLATLSAPGAGAKSVQARPWLALQVSTAVITAVAATHHVQTYFVHPQTQELAAARTAVSLVPPAVDLLVVPSHWSNSIAPAAYYEEFGIPSSAVPWVPVALSQLVTKEQSGGWRGRAALVTPEFRRASNDDASVLDFGVMLERGTAAAVLTAQECRATLGVGPRVGPPARAGC